ncbi:multiple epidermal growth factor-like domains protein 10 [Haliotis rubra]|uniref:multiple epidermal growth factor-like domains protein 10 n=1 Tax=Haliotis rubra TaxID=36100 RepID=UPI001EE5DA50|nr:multiple epidermal growth factor-like domains protein 10 [Haliotis rubra]
MKVYFAAVCSVIAGVAVVMDAACHCNTPDACSVFPTTPCSQTGDPDRCQEGWFGPYCQKQNVALRRPSIQSATWFGDHHFTADLAVDGRATTMYKENPPTCTHTAGGTFTPHTWTVYLNTSSTDRIQNMRLYLRENRLYRNVGMEILVSSQMCYNWSSTEHPPPVADVTCRQPLTGNNVTIRVPGGKDICLTLCEVQIFVCSDGWFGTDCDKKCKCPKHKGLCDKITGRCLVCLDFSYGINCASQCGNCLNGDACDKTTGTCPRGCASGWTTDMCQSSCSDGRHGHHCQSECGQCRGNLPCNKINGTCHQRCQPGFQEPFCKECVDGMYGDDCMSRCGQCKDDLTCNKSSGECPEGCQGNLVKPLCQDCPAASGRSNWEVPVAATLGSLVVLAVIALLTSIIYITRMKKQLAALQKKPENDYMSLDETTRDPVVESIYENTDNNVL